MYATHANWMLAFNQTLGKQRISGTWCLPNVATKQMSVRQDALGHPWIPQKFMKFQIPITHHLSTLPKMSGLKLCRCQICIAASSGMKQLGNLPLWWRRIATMKCLLLRDPIFVVAHELLVILPFSKESHIFQVARLLWCVVSHGTPHLLKTW